jgi:hypothetical protein
MGDHTNSAPWLNSLEAVLLSERQRAAATYQQSSAGSEAANRAGACPCEPLRLECVSVRSESGRRADAPGAVRSGPET